MCIYIYIIRLQVWDSPLKSRFPASEAVEKKPRLGSIPVINFLWCLSNSSLEATKPSQPPYTGKCSLPACKVESPTNVRVVPFFLFK